ncbi:MAG: acylneuraminate cytidylyltransferase family protein [Pseudobdellovibrionaceae bacterium]
MQSKIVALLPMKANSERVRGKNFRMMAGKPLFQWVLDALLGVPSVSKVVINTDARHILAENGLVDSERVLIRDRKPEICGDFVSMNLVLKDDVESVPADAYIMTHTTNPLLTAATVQKCVEAYQAGLKSGKNDSLFTVTKHQTRFYKKDGSPINHDPNNLIRTQDLEPYFEENSNLYLFSRESFIKTNARIGKAPILFEMTKTESVDIDDPETWDIAEALIRFQQSKK